MFKIHKIAVLGMFFGIYGVSLAGEPEDRPVIVRNYNPKPLTGYSEPELTNPVRENNHLEKILNTPIKLRPKSDHEVFSNFINEKFSNSSVEGSNVDKPNFFYVWDDDTFTQQKLIFEDKKISKPLDFFYKFRTACKVIKTKTIKKAEK